jgi:hypothetical protein
MSDCHSFLSVSLRVEKFIAVAALYVCSRGCSATAAAGVETFATLVAVVLRTRVPLIRAALPDSSRR